MDSIHSVSVYLLKNLISENFEVSKKIRLFNFFGLEIIDDSDLSNFSEYMEKYRVIFFTKADDYFENKNFIRTLNIKNKLGEGGFAKVYMAEHKFSHLNFALKIFRYDYTLVNDLNFLFKEIEALRRLENKHIIRLYTYCILESNKIALFLEYAAGGTLKGN
jgi:hypothetical protein